VIRSLKFWGFQSYSGQPFFEHYLFDTELVERVISNLKRGKAANVDDLTDEHLQYSHALLPVVLSKLFNLMICNGCVPRKFGQSYTVPILKSSCNLYGKSMIFVASPLVLLYPRCSNTAF